MDNRREHTYKISVVMPLYNVAKYLDEAIDSIVRQSIGFEENIQLILVNDGSPDSVDEICKKYLNLYPDNVVYLEQSNSGVSAARNAGLEYIEGKYVNFFDGDDKWAEDAFQRMYCFIEEHYEQVDFVSARICYFERRSGFEHPLDYKFEKSRVIDIIDEYNCIQLSGSASLIKSEIAKQHLFDTNLSHGEDAAYLNKILLDKMAYGIVKEAVYYYRKRMEKTSALDSSKSLNGWYFNTVNYFSKMIIQESQKRMGYVIPYVQFLVMYDLQWKITAPLPAFFSELDKSEYGDSIVELLNNIEDKIIIEQKQIGIPAKLFALSLKYQKDIRDELYLDGSRVLFRGIYVFNVRGNKRLTISNLKIRKDVLYIEGTTQLHILPENYSIEITDSDGNRIPVEYYHIQYKDKESFTGKSIFVGRGFRIAVEIERVKEISFSLTRNGEKCVKLSPSFEKFGKLNRLQKNTYYAHGMYIIKSANRGLKIIRNGVSSRVASELRYIKNTLFPQKKYYLIFMRISAFIWGVFQKKQIWIISDRSDMARDNGEAFFSYVTSLKSERKKKFYFALDKSSVDYKRIKKIGQVLPIGTFRYKLCFLIADKIISAHADDWVINAFGNDEEYMKSLYDFDYIFLQHGITKDDLSSWLHKTKKDIRLFVTSASREYESIVKGLYGYTVNDVVLSGLPRYDGLYSKPEKQIVFMPTWRKSISEKTIEGSSKRPYSDGFKKSSYFKFYNALINDKKLLQAMEKNGYKGEFINHPAFAAQARDFSGNSTVSVVNSEADYSRVFCENSLLVTDYSSVAFDFSYMKKPVIYCQFDRDTFFESHTYKDGYFDYEEDGFGPVCHTYEETVNTIVKYIEDDCSMKDLYKTRVDNFFKWTDRENCKRVFDCIEALGSSRE